MTVQTPVQPDTSRCACLLSGLCSARVADMAFREEHIHRRMCKGKPELQLQFV